MTQHSRIACIYNTGILCIDMHRLFCNFADNVCTYIYIFIYLFIYTCMCVYAYRHLYACLYVPVSMELLVFRICSANFAWQVFTTNAVTSALLAYHAGEVSFRVPVTTLFRQKLMGWNLPWHRSRTMLLTSSFILCLACIPPLRTGRGELWT
jgi:hypothetical protein